jgi:hypothetical protein
MLKRASNLGFMDFILQKANLFWNDVLKNLELKMMAKTLIF